MLLHCSKSLFVKSDAGPLAERLTQAMGKPIDVLPGTGQEFHVACNLIKGDSHQQLLDLFQREGITVTQQE